ncbi:MAG: ATP-binding protein [Pirellulales bacterium]|nr:ATP-binding protein [Pirellulales bacterium]
MKELVIVSGKGGTGKTSMAASLASLAAPVVLADCDVDAADLHLVVEPRINSRNDFLCGSKARIKPGHCTACGKCEELCRFDAIFYDGPGNGRVARTFRVDSLACEGCGVCADYCVEGAIEFKPVVAGQWFVSTTKYGPMVHARLAAAAENSGKLVTQLRQTAQQMVQSQGLELVICDGSPGIGCPVIASLTGASLALIIVEPTMAALHDFERIARLTVRLGIPALLAVNKADLNKELAERLETAAVAVGIEPAGRVPYDPEVTRAQIAGRSVVEASAGPAAEAVRALWQRVNGRLQGCAESQAGGLVQMGVKQ